MSISDFLQKRINDKGWFSVGNIYFDNSFVIHPFTSKGYVALSPEADMMFTLGKLDSANTDALEKEYLVLNNRYIGFQQTIVCVGLDQLQHFEAMLYSHERFVEHEKEFPLPKIPSITDIEAMTPDPETGLYDGMDEVTLMDGRKISTIALYPNNPYDTYSGLRIRNYQRFITNQKFFVKACNELFGLSDCI